MCCDVAQVKETIWYTIKASINFPYQQKKISGKEKSIGALIAWMATDLA